MVRVRVCCLLVQIFNLGLDDKNSVPPIIELPTILFILFYLPISQYHFSLTLSFPFLPHSLSSRPSLIPFSVQTLHSRGADAANWIDILYFLSHSEPESLNSETHRIG